MITEKDEKGKKIEGETDMQGVGRLESRCSYILMIKCLLSMYCVLDTVLGRGVKTVDKMGVVHVLMTPRVCQGVPQVRAVMGKNRMLAGTQVGSLPLSWSIRKGFLEEVGLL